MTHIERLDIGSRISGIVIHGNTVYLKGHVASEVTAGRSVSDRRATFSLKAMPRFHELEAAGAGYFMQRSA